MLVRVLLVFVLLAVVYVLTRPTEYVEAPQGKQSSQENIEVPQQLKSDSLVPDNSDELKSAHQDDVQSQVCVENDELSAEEFIANESNYLDSLVDETDPDKLIVQALFSSSLDTQQKLDKLFLAFQQQPDNKLLVKELVTSCIDTTDTKCNNSFIELAISKDRNNAALWLEVIKYYVAKKDDDNVRHAISKLNQSTFYNERLGQKIQLYEQTMLEAGNDDFHRSVFTVMRQSYSNDQSAFNVVKWCGVNRRSLTDKESCLTLGEDLYRLGQNSETRSLGISVKRAMLHPETDKERFQQLHEEQSELNYETTVLFEFLKNPKETALRNWVMRLDNIGGLKAALDLVSEGDFSNQLNTCS